MGRIEADFKFDIGDVVTTKAALLTLSKEHLPAIMILDLRAHKCHGGVQMEYLCKVMLRGDGGLTSLEHVCKSFMEPELVEFPADATGEALVAQKKAADDLMWHARMERVAKREASKRTPDDDTSTEGNA